MAEEADKGAAEGGGRAEAHEEVEAEDGGWKHEGKRDKGLDDAAGPAITVARAGATAEPGGERRGEEQERGGGEGRKAEGQPEGGQSIADKCRGIVPRLVFGAGEKRRFAAGMTEKSRRRFVTQGNDTRQRRKRVMAGRDRGPVWRVAAGPGGW